MKRIRPSIVVHEGPNEKGEYLFTKLWNDRNGVFVNEPSLEDGEPVGYRRAQIFRAQLTDKRKKGYAIIDERRTK